MSDYPPKQIDPAYTIRIVPQDRFAEITLRGFWTLEVLRCFEADVRAEFAMLAAAGCPMGEQVTLFDLTGFQVQGQDVVTGLTVLANDTSIRSRYTALVLRSGLLKLQARRVGPEFGLFDTHEAAMAWVAEMTESAPTV